MKLFQYRVIVPESEDQEFREWIDKHNQNKPAISNVCTAKYWREDDVDNQSEGEVK